MSSDVPMYKAGSVSWAAPVALHGHDRGKTISLIPPAPLRVPDTGFRAVEGATHLPKQYVPTMRAIYTWDHVATLITMSASGSVLFGHTSGTNKSEAHVSSFARSIGVEVSADVNVQIAKLNASVSASMKWTDSQTRQLGLTTSESSTVRFDAQPRTATSIWQPIVILESDSGLTTTQRIPWYQSVVQQLDLSGTKLEILIAGGNKLVLNIPRELNSLPDHPGTEIDSAFRRPAGISRRQAIAARHWWNLCGAEWVDEDPPHGLREFDMNSGRVRKLWSHYTRVAWAPRESGRVATNPELGHALPELPSGHNWPGLGFDFILNSLPHDGVWVSFPDPEKEHLFSTMVAHDWRAIADGGMPTWAGKDGKWEAGSDPDKLTDEGNIHSRHTWKSTGGGFVAGGGFSFSQSAGIDETRSRTSSFSSAIGASVSQEVGTDLLSVSTKLDASISRAQEDTYAFGVSEENTVSFDLELPKDGAMRQAGYSVLSIKHNVSGGGPAVTDLANVVFQWDMPMSLD